MHVMEAGTVVEALARLRATASQGQPFDAVLVQLWQPGSSVFDFAEAACAEGLGPRTRLILLDDIDRQGE